MERPKPFNTICRKLYPTVLASPAYIYIPSYDLHFLVIIYRLEPTNSPERGFEVDQRTQREKASGNSG